MSKDKLQLLSPLFLKYQTDFEKNPRSRVFAPLAETYRKLGMTDKAMEILSQGIRFHPTYLMGYLGLAFCYFDLKQFGLAYSTIRPLVEANRDNLRLQRLFSDICIELGKKEEALETLKYLLFINPRDKDVAELVQRVEKEVEDKYKPIHRPIIIPEKDLTAEASYGSESSIFDLEKLDGAQKIPNDFDDWMTVDFNQDSKGDKKSSEDDKATTFDQWNIKKGDEKVVPSHENTFNSTNSYRVHLDLEEDFETPLVVARKEANMEFVQKQHKEEVQENEDDTPLVTHTLVDLYCGQGHIEKALEVLEKILLLNPNDQKTINKIKEIKALSQPLEKYDDEQEKESAPKAPAQVPIHLVDDLEEVSEEAGRRNLMSLIDEKLGPIEIPEDDMAFEKAKLIEKRLSLFLKKIQKRALDYQRSV